MSHKIKEAFRQQKAFFASGRTLGIEHRLQALAALEAGIEKNKDKIIDAVSRDLHRPSHESILTDFNICLEEIRFARKHLRSWAKPRRVKTPPLLWPARSEMVYEPLGVALIIAPWNFPFQLALNPLVAALAAGCCAIIKPSELMPHCSRALGEILAGIFPNEQVCVIEGAVAETTALLELPFDHIFFTGSTAVGKIVMQAAAKNLTSVTLELGGKSPAIVESDADLAKAARRIAWGKVMNAGQTCVAPDYAYVHRSVSGRFLELLKKEINEQLEGNPRASKSFARIVNERHHRRLAKLIDKSKVRIGGEVDEKSLYIAPTVMTGVSWNDPVMSEEIFGPILPVLEYDDINEVFAVIRSKPKPLAAFLFSNSGEKADRFLKQVSFGGGCVNDVIVHLSNPCMPFGGVGQSGMGGYHGHFGFLAFSHTKSVLYGSTLIDLPVRYPPYTPAKTALLNRLLSILRFIPGMRF